MSAIALARPAPGVALLTLDRPEKLNALAGTMREDLLAALEALAADDTARAVVITGAGRAFCAGGDLAALAELVGRADRSGLERLLDLGAAIVLAIRGMAKPVIAAVNGVAAGAGCNLALACDLRLAADTASFAQSFARVGLHPDWGGSALLPRLVGSARACELTWRAEPIDARTAERIGLVNAVLPASALAGEALALAAALAARPPLPLALSKHSIYAALDGDLPAALAREKAAQLACMLSDDAREGIAAFLEKREPRFPSAI